MLVLPADQQPWEPACGSRKRSESLRFTALIAPGSQTQGSQTLPHHTVSLSSVSCFPASENLAILALTQGTASLLTRDDLGMRSSETVNELAPVLQGKYRLGREPHTSVLLDSLINVGTGHCAAHVPVPSSNLPLLRTLP